MSSRQAHVIFIVDPGLETVVWAHRGGFRAQHDARVLPSGNLLLFDNGLHQQGSRVLEFEPRTMEIVWQYGRPNEDLFSPNLSTAERLLNGNTLITESDRGRALEVTSLGDIVWEWRTPHTVVEDGTEMISMVPEMLRLPPDTDISWAVRPR